MAKRDQKGPSKAEEAEDHDATDEHDDGGHAAPARPASAQERRARMRERRNAVAADDHGHARAGHDHGHGHGHDHDEDEIDTSNDPSWWVPHAVLGALVLIGILGFFGAFNGLAARAGYGGIPGLVPTADPHASSQPASHSPPPPPKPAERPPMPQRPEAREMFGAKHLLVMYKGSMRAPENITRTKDEAKARAEEAMKKAKAGAKFEDLVKEYSDEPGAGARGGDLGKFPKGRMVPQFQEGLEKTKVGGISDLVETPFGYHVILRTQ